jgi:hypothetical protein
MIDDVTSQLQTPRTISKPSLMDVRGFITISLCESLIEKTPKSQIDHLARSKSCAGKRLSTLAT